MRKRRDQNGVKGSQEYIETEGSSTNEEWSTLSAGLRVLEARDGVSVLPLCTLDTGATVSLLEFLLDGSGVTGVEIVLQNFHFQIFFQNCLASDTRA
jgi:hypothetical protein